MSQVPLVDYLVLGDPSRTSSRTSARRAAPATSTGATRARAASGTEFRDADVATDGEVRAFTIVSLAAPGIPVPFVAGVIDCDGTSVRANVINTPPDPEHVHARDEGAADDRSPWAPTAPAPRRSASGSNRRKEN